MFEPGTLLVDLNCECLVLAEHLNEDNPRLIMVSDVGGYSNHYFARISIWHEANKEEAIPFFLKWMTGIYAVLESAQITIGIPQAAVHEAIHKLRSAGYLWPELDVIEKSIRANETPDEADWLWQ